MRQVQTNKISKEAPLRKHGMMNNIKVLKKLMKKKNPEAFMQMAERYKNGKEILQSYTKSLEMRICAAELGHADAFVNIGYFYDVGLAVEQDKSKTLEFYEIAAKKGSVQAHQYLALYHGKRRNIDKSVRHCKVAASAGDQQSMDGLMKAYRDKLLTKEELSQTLRAFQTAKDLMKSKDRDAIKAMQEYYVAQDR